MSETTQEQETLGLACTHAGPWPVHEGACLKCFSAMKAEVERLRLHMDGCGRTTYALAKSAEKAEAALRQIAAWSWDSGSTPAPEVVSRIYCEARAVLRDSAPGGKP